MSLKFSFPRHCEEPIGIARVVFRSNLQIKKGFASVFPSLKPFQKPRNDVEKGLINHLPGCFLNLFNDIEFISLQQDDV